MTIMPGIKALLGGKSFDQGTSWEWSGGPLGHVWSETLGFGASVSWDGRNLRLTCDRVRSTPLYYRASSEGIEVADTAGAAVLGSGSLTDWRAVRDYLDFGYCLGKSTLVQGLSQVQAGESIVFDLRRKDWRHPVASQRSSAFNPAHRPEDHGDRHLVSDFRTVNQVVFERLAEMADGRPILIPLSGGLDSRLVAVWCRRVGIDNLIAFSYGSIADRETQVSRSVAECLGIPWHFVQYTPNKWKRLARSESFRSYLGYAAATGGIPHVQDLLALLELRDAIPNAIVVPGHSGDFVAGSHLEESLLRSRHVSERQFRQALRRRHSGVTPAAVINSVVGERSETGYGLPWSSEWADPTRAAVELDAWDARERQAKFIVNSVRAYEWLGLSWWLPQWDAEYTRFFETLGTTNRLHCSFYREYCSELFRRHEVADPPQLAGPQSAWRIKTRMANHLRRLGMLDLSVKDAEFSWGTLRGALAPRYEERLARRHVNSAVGLAAFEELVGAWG